MRALGLPLVALALFSMLGGHYATIQGVAWATMLWNYSREEKSLLIGAEKTFGGQAPCSMCKAVKSSREQEEQKTPVTVKIEKKAEMPFSFREITAPLPRSAFAALARGDTRRLLSRREAPPTPVPLA